MSCFGLVWAWLGSNSGQIQIVIAIVALIYAWKAYQKVLHQIEISNIQTENSNMQSIYNSRINTLELINVNIEKILRIIRSLTQIKKRLEKVHDSCEKKGFEQVEEIKNQLNEVEKALTKCHRIKERLDKKLTDSCDPNSTLMDEILMDLFKQVADANTVLHHCELIEPTLEKYINSLEDVK